MFEDELIQQAVNHKWRKEIFPQKIRQFLWFLLGLLMVTGVMLQRTGLLGDQYSVNAGIRKTVGGPSDL